MFDNLQIIHKKVKHANLKVKPNLNVILTVPLGTNQNTIERILSKRKDWLLKQLAYFKKYMVVTKELVSGESFAYLGRNYRLKIIEAEIESVTICDEYLHININDKSDYKKKLKLIDAWYKKQAEHHFLLIIDKYLKIVKKEVNKISIKQMKTRWGSCNPKKAYINLNLELIKKHPSAIEYVILHEIAHLEHYNHNRNFYNYVASYMPDWQLRRSKLRDATHL